MTHGQFHARPSITFPVVKHRCPVIGTKLYCLVKEAYVCEQLAESRYLEAERPGVELATSRISSQHPNHYTTQATRVSLAKTAELVEIQLYADLIGPRNHVLNECKYERYLTNTTELSMFSSDAGYR